MCSSSGCKHDEKIFPDASSTASPESALSSIMATSETRCRADPAKPTSWSSIATSSSSSCLNDSQWCPSMPSLLISTAAAAAVESAAAAPADSVGAGGGAAATVAAAAAPPAAAPAP
eukprot:CAMPEP_0181342834 /NCGR_PEP_ID=MMETSP1101-20121128/31230_1 /TAXON_ID=46948 /ORGANISM="Rhodomonas abbreviata, Strain Caron Lab Isolate" /LENGTH=116 /DNA_ID=CAMNT_0023454355 /DNA_START=562 /DNA_END=909 /DNA_ORIENTATION=-